MRLVVESGVLFQRALREIPRVPTRIAFPVIGPVMQLVLLTAVLTSVTQCRVTRANSSVQFMTAGVLALTVLAGAGGAGFQMVQDIDTGFFDKLRVAPISRAAIVLGLLLTDATRLAVQSLDRDRARAAAGRAHRDGLPRIDRNRSSLAAIFGMAWSGISLNVALRTRNPEVTAAAGVLTFPLYFGSTAFMPHELLPDWLQVFNIIQPDQLPDPGRPRADVEPLGLARDRRRAAGLADRGSDHDAAGHAGVPARGLRLRAATRRRAALVGSRAWNCWTEKRSSGAAGRRGGRCSPSTSSGCWSPSPSASAAQLVDSFTSVNGHVWWFWLVTVVLILITLVGRLAQAHRHALHRHEPAHQHPPRHLLARRPRDVVRAPAERQDLPEPDRAHARGGPRRLRHRGRRRLRLQVRRHQRPGGSRAPDRGASSAPRCRRTRTRRRSTASTRATSG